MNYGKDNTVLVRVNNGEQLDVMPLVGDFNFYGGIYRDVHLLVTEDICISPLDYASPGVYLFQQHVGEKQAAVLARINLSNGTEHPRQATLRLQVKEGDKVVYQADKKVTVAPHTSVQPEEMSFTLLNPRLWNGREDPFMYQTVITLVKDGKEIDRREEEIGFRYFHADAEKGFFLNGKPYRLNGVNRHQDRAERASAFYPQDHDEDLDLMQEMGCNAVRLCHYPQAKYMHQQMDKRGLVAWAEIPFVNVYVNNPAYDENLRLQLKELILQNYNHPCILFWGLFNEINSGWLDRPSRMAAELHALARQLDPSRPTMGASNQDDDFNGFTDLIAFNKYFGWYGDNMDDMGRWIDREHAAHPERKMGISEYGAGACVFQQEDSLRHPEPWGQWHPENWQTYYHVENWKQLQEREFLWCNFIWCMFDFSAAGRREGSIMGRNDKGLVTYDRKIKKDAFYFYKANWNQEDKFVYIAGKRLVNRTRKTVDVQVFSNSGAAKLYINGKAYGTAKPDSVNVLEWKGIVLDTGENRIEVRNKYGADCCVWICPF